MTASAFEKQLIEVLFFGRDGEREYLWCLEQSNGLYEVRTPPAFIDNIAIGALVEVRTRNNKSLEHARTVAPSVGVTLRFMTPNTLDAREVYASRIESFALEKGLGIGPASFVAKKMVAFHVARKDHPSEQLLDCLEQLERESVVTAWEIGDSSTRVGRLSGEFDGIVIRHEKPT